MADPFIITNRRQLLMTVGGSVLTGNGLFSNLLKINRASSFDPAYAAYLRVTKAENAVNNFKGNEEADYYESLIDTFIAAERKLAAIPARSLFDIHCKMKRLVIDQCWQLDNGTISAALGLSILADLDCLKKI